MSNETEENMKTLFDSADKITFKKARHPEKALTITIRNGNVVQHEIAHFRGLLRWNYAHLLIFGLYLNKEINNI